jgi:hypothetical protein
MLFKVLLMRYIIITLLFNPLKLILVLIIFKLSLHTSKKTQPIAITMTNQLMLFRKIIAVYSENCMKLTNTLCGQDTEWMIFKAGGTYSSHKALKG